MAEERSTARARIPFQHGKSFVKACLDSGLFEAHTVMLQQLTNEFKREMVGQREQDDSEESEEELQVLTAEDILKERTRVSKIVKKGVGYNFSGGTGWNPSTY